MLIIISIAILVAIIFAELGCVVLWQRYAYFGDGLVHACIFSGSLNLLFGIPAIAAIALTAILYNCFVSLISTRSDRNVAISISSSMMLTFALLLNSVYGDMSSLNHLLLGDMLFVTKTDLYFLVAIMICSSLLLMRNYKIIVFLSLSEQLAKTYGINVRLYKWMIFAALALIVTMVIPIVGGLLCTAMLILPAASARLISTSPKQMILFSIILAVITNLLGVLIAIYCNLPISPAILLIGAVVYFLLHLKAHLYDGAL